MNRPTLYRIYRIINLIKEHNGVSLSDIAEDIEVCERTVLRDINHLRHQMRIPIEFDKHRKYWYLENSNFSLPPLYLTDEDYKSLRVGFDILKFISPYPDEKVIRRAVDALGFIVQKNFPKYEISFLSAGYAGHFVSDNDKLSKAFEEIMEAVKYRLKIKIKYYSPHKNEFSSRIIWPLHLHNHGGSWFMLGFDERKSDFRLFGLNRINRMEILQGKFEAPKDFEKEGYAEDYVKRCFSRQLGRLYSVKIKFDSYQSRWIKEQSWFENQENRESKDGEITMQFEVSELEELKRWIMQYGAHTKALAPKELKNLIKEEIEKMGKVYK